MGRGDGFAIADIASDYLDDEKVRRLWRRLGDVVTMCEALTLHQATVLASWRSGRRVTVDEAAPLWLPVSEVLVAELVAVGMIDRTRRVPARSWSSWYGPAEARRSARVEAGRLGGQAKAKRSSSDATATLYPSVPSLPTVPSVARPRARGRRGADGGGPTSLGDAIAGTPFGKELERRRTT